MVDSILEKTWQEKTIIYEYDRIMETREWMEKIPPIKFPSHWFIKITPPFAGAVIRFRVSLTKDFEHDVSIYLDCYDSLGYFGEPYWEVYPHDGDTYRCAMHDIDDLLKAISDGLGEIENEITLEVVNAQIESIESELRQLEEFRVDLMIKINLEAYHKSMEIKDV